MKLTPPSTARFSNARQPSRSLGGPQIPDPRSPAETSEFRNLEQTYTILADNEDWLVLNAGKIVPASDYDIIPTREEEQDNSVGRAKHDERILHCLAAWGV
jgi:hypothetical protein